MAHEIYRVTSFQKIGPFTLSMQFDDGTSQTIDFRPVLKGELYGPLQDPMVFSQVRIDPEVHTLVWPNGAYQSRYPGQVVLVVAYRDYIFLVPSVEEQTHYFLKTIIPSRKATRDYLRSGEDDEES
jgi:uncharacterized protein DUF2442